MYENEFNAALQAIAESVNEAQFDAIIEGASALIESYDLPMDEAVATSAAALFNENVIDADSYSVTSAVMDEFANRPVSWDEALGFIAEAVGEEQFDAIMSENVAGMLDALSEAGEIKGDLLKAGNAIDTAYGKGRNAAISFSKKVPGAVKGAAKNVTGYNDFMKAKKNFRDSKVYKEYGDKENARARSAAGRKDLVKGGAKALGTTAATAAAARLAYNASQGDALKDVKALRNAAQKKLADMKAKKAEAVEAPEGQKKLGESAGVYTLADMRAMVQG